MPNKYSFVAASGMPSVTVTNPERPIHDSRVATRGERRSRSITTDAASTARAATCPTVATARVTLEELNAGHCTREKAYRPTAATAAATTAAATASALVLRAVRMTLFGMALLRWGVCGRSDAGRAAAPS